MVAATRPAEDAAALRLGALSAMSFDVAERLRDSVVLVAGRRGGAGAGTIWDAGGVIVTNNHVAPGDNAEVTLRDGRTFQAAVSAHDPENDLAALRIDAIGLPAIEARDSDSVRVGEVVIAVGNPWGQRGAVSSGIVFSKDGASVDGLDTHSRAIRADVALAPGNSGGPLADSDGRVIGVNAMIAGGMAVAIPSNTVSDFLAAGRAEPGFIGITAEAVPIPASLESEDGGALIITSVAEGSPAELAGLIPGDLLLGVGDEPASMASAATALKRMRAGVPVSLAVARAGVPRRFEATPAAQSSD